MGDLTTQLGRIVATTKLDLRGDKGGVNTTVDSTAVLPFLKWAGGKRWLSPLAIKLRGMEIRRYFEPFLGSGAMFFGVEPQIAYLSDTNADLVDTYKALQQDWSSVLNKLREHDRKHCADYYYKIRAQSPIKMHTRAARFIYLNRTCWNGLYRVNRFGVFNTPIGTKLRAVLETDDFELVSKRLKEVRLSVSDFEKSIDMSGKGDLVFADPPYTVRHQYNGFIKYNERLFSWMDQERLCGALIKAKRRGAAIICTNADHKSIRELYGADFELTPVKRYSAIAGSGGVRGNYAELLVTG